MPKKILLADDSVTIQKVVSITLAHEDFDLTIVDNGSKAVAKAKEIKPDVILLDVVMPDKDGYQVCQEIKANAELKGVPIILLTGTFEPFDADRAAEVGADDFIKKPFESHTLINKVKEMAARSGVARGKPVDISGVDIDFETPVEAEYAEKPAGKRPRDDQAALGDNLETPWEGEPKMSRRPVEQQEGEDIWSVEEFEDIAGTKAQAAPRAKEAAPTGRPAAGAAEKAPVRGEPRQAPAREEAVSDDFFVGEGKSRDVDIEDFELGEEISEDELEKFLEEETDDTELSVEEGRGGGDIGVSEGDDELLFSDEAPPARRGERPAEPLDADLLVEDFDEPPARRAEGDAGKSDDFFIEDTVDDEPVELEWEDEPLPAKGKARSVEKGGGDFETLIRRTTEEELADFSQKRGAGPDAGRKPETEEFELDLSPFEEEPREEVKGGRQKPATFDFDDLSEEIPSGGGGAAPGRAAAGAAGSLNQKDVSTAVDKIAREVIEKVVWEVVPELAEELIKQEIKRLKGEKA